MARITDQTIPAELQTLYDGALGTSEWVPDTYRAHKRIPFRLPRLQGCRTIRSWIPRGDQVSDPMCINRHVFGDCVKCFNKQPWAGGAEPDGIGPYSRTWWFTEAIGKLPWYFNYFIRKTMDLFVADTPPDWCSLLATSIGWVYEEFPNNGYCNGSAHVAARIAAGEAQIYLHKDSNEYKTLWLHRKAIFDQGGLGVPPLILAVYDVPDDWVCGTLTWNNKPALGNLISIYYITNITKTWYRFYTGNSMRVAIVCTKDNWYTEWDGVGDPVPASRPRWTS